MYKKYSIDSMRLRCESRFIHIVDKSLVNNLILIDSSTSEIVDDDFKKPRFKYLKDGISCYIALESRTVFDKSIKGGCYQREDLVVLVNAKQLKNRYLEGINFNTIDLIYDFLMSLKVFWCEKDVFYRFFYCYDIDIKRDFHMPVDDFINMTKLMEDLVKPTKRRDSMPHRFLGRSNVQSFKFIMDPLSGGKEQRCVQINEVLPTNVGIEFGRRGNTTESRPYLKYYYKWGELNTKSKDFNDAYCINPHKDLIRQEFTIKDKKHLQRVLGNDMQDNSLLSVCQLPNFQDDLLKVSKYFHAAHFSKMNRVSYSDSGDLSLADSALKMALTCILDLGGTLDKYFLMCEEFLNHKNRYRFIKKINSLGVDKIDKTEVERSKNIVEFLLQFLPS